MMSVKEYALELGISSSLLIEACHSLEIQVATEDDMLDDIAITILDQEKDRLFGKENTPEASETEEAFVDDDELEQDLRIHVEENEQEVKMKKKKVLRKEDKTKFLKEKKEMYRHKEKLEKLDSTPKKEDNIVLYHEGMSVKDLADSLNVSATEILKKLMDLGIMTNINQSLDFQTAEILVVDYNKILKKEETRDLANFEEFEVVDNEEDLKTRPPVVTIMGHVDHGKTSLLDAIRSANVVSKEAGGITQHIGAYQVKIKDRYITFIDTPGHEAFTQMRARGASATDIVVIIVSAEDGIKPQTIEAIDHAKAANVPIIVAINKMDLPNANPDRVLQELVEYGLTPEEWGGDTLVNRISAKTKMGLDDLLENILFIADMKELKANPSRYATGVVLEARVDKNSGATITLLIQNGTLRIGDPIVVGNAHGKVRTLKNDLGENIASALPATPVEITGVTELPVAGDHFMAFETEKEARKIAEERAARNKEANTNRTGMTLEDLFSKVQDGAKRISVILKTDVKGSEEAIKQSLAKINIEGVRVDVIRSGVGTITESDIVLAHASNAFIIGFNVRPSGKTLEVAKEYQVDIRLYNVIYKVIEELEQAILGRLEPEYEEKKLGTAEIRHLFHFSKVGTIAGCFVQDGSIKANDKARLIRDGIVVYDGKIGSLQREKDRVNEVKKGMECGITIENYNDLKENDLIEAYTLVEVKR